MLMRNAAMYFIGVPSLRALQAGPADKLPDGRGPVGQARAESHDEEEQVMSFGDRFLQGPIRFPRDPLLPIPSDRSPAPPRNDDRETISPASVAPVQELHSTALDSRGRRKKLPDLAVA